MEDIYSQLGGCQVSELFDQHYDLNPISHYTMEDRVIDIDIGLKNLEKVTGGIEAGTIDLIAAPTGVGKTTMSLALAKLQCKLGKKCCYVSTEMNKRDIYKKIRYCSPDDFKNLTFISLTDNTDINYIVNCIKAIIEVGKFDIIYFDYINSATLYYKADRTVPQDQLITILLQKVRELLDGTNTHITCFSQTNRMVYTSIPDQNVVQGSASAANKVDLGATLVKCKDKYERWIKKIDSTLQTNILLYVYKNRASEFVDCFLPLYFDYKYLNVSSGSTIITSDRINWSNIK